MTFYMTQAWARQGIGASLRFRAAMAAILDFAILMDAHQRRQHLPMLLPSLIAQQEATKDE
jgi:hypothetical protein